jgi:hypothetical protein
VAANLTIKTEMEEGDKKKSEIPITTQHTTILSTNQEGDVAEASLDYTLSEEGEGDNISGNKELREQH